MRGEGRKRPSRQRTLIHTLGILLFIVLVLTCLNTISEASDQTQSRRGYQIGSWGLGVVVPEGSGFAGGGRLSWANATVVSVTITLPNISFTDYPLYAVESLMAEDGSVMQVAAGLYPNTTKWFGYGWYIKTIQAENYEWVINASKPEMAPGATVSLSISLYQSRWQYRIEDLSTSVSMVGDYANVPPVVREGDQEVFAFESYSTSNVVFADMGNLTLDSLMINGRQISSGWYTYGHWDNRHNPLFVVGGINPPAYISLQEGKQSTLIWSYEQWSGSQEVPPSTPILAVVAGTPFVIVLLMCAFVWVKRRHVKN